jgi:hypothetical protein
MAIYKDMTIVIDEKRISGTVYFDTLDEDRLVDSRLSAAIILMLKECVKNNNDERFNCDLLLAENIGVISHELKYSQLIVDRNYRLLKPDTIISFDEALFLLLGLNTESLQYILPNTYTLLGNKPSLGTIEHVLSLTPVYEVLSRSKFINNGEILSNDLAEISKQFSFINQARLNCIINSKLSKNRVVKDSETGIPNDRLLIYKETLPLFLKGLGVDETTSLRGLSINSSETYEGKYTIKYKVRLGVGGAAVKKDLSSLLKSSWWKTQPDEIRKKVPYFLKK